MRYNRDNDRMGILVGSVVGFAALVMLGGIAYAALGETMFMQIVYLTLAMIVYGVYLYAAFNQAEDRGNSPEWLDRLPGFVRVLVVMAAPLLIPPALVVAAVGTVLSPVLLGIYASKRGAQSAEARDLLVKKEILMLQKEVEEGRS